MEVALRFVRFFFDATKEQYRKNRRGKATDTFFCISDLQEHEHVGLWSGMRMLLA